MEDHGSTSTVAIRRGLEPGAEVQGDRGWLWSPYLFEFFYILLVI
jgi:hypothetical protein